MAERVVPMIHVPDVRATVDWYKAIGFTVTDTYDDGGEGLSRHQRLKDRVEVVKGLHDTFYGPREFIIRDLNRFWMTFAQFASDR